MRPRTSGFSALRMVTPFRWRARPATLAGVMVVAAGCGSVGDGGGGTGGRDVLVSDPGPIHVHGLGVNPRDGALFIATHTGLFRAAPGQSKASRVEDRYQDTMGFTVAGPDRFLGSGHPDGRSGDPPFLGLIRSEDAGKTWQPISLRGDTDFHVLEASGEHVYGFGSDYDSRKPQFLVSQDGGRSWERRDVPEQLIALAMHPKDPDHLFVSGERGLHESTNGGRSWRPRRGNAGLIAWVESEQLVLVSKNGRVLQSTDGSSWRAVGNIDGRPAAFEAEEDGLYVALHDGTIKRSTDLGRSWSVRSKP